MFQPTNLEGDKVLSPFSAQKGRRHDSAFLLGTPTWPKGEAKGGDVMEASRGRRVQEEEGTTGCLNYT